MKIITDSRAERFLGRRTFLKLSRAAAAGASLSTPLLSGCSDGSNSDGSNNIPAVDAPMVVDPATPWWLQNNFGPVYDELSVYEPSVRGTIPEGLSGLYVRNGSNPRNADSPHWFFGDGMIHGVRFENGRPTWYGNRYIQTPLYELGLGLAIPMRPHSAAITRAMSALSTTPANCTPPARSAFPIWSTRTRCQLSALMILRGC